MHGFKSFANKEVMKLGQGITTVVGPNGCGKTNIVDAIRWVLGEQKYSVLRSGKMEDVIFNGAEGIKPLGVCEVAMTVHNNSGKLPIEYNDVEIKTKKDESFCKSNSQHNSNSGGFGSSRYRHSGVSWNSTFSRGSFGGGGFGAASTFGSGFGTSSFGFGIDKSRFDKQDFVHTSTSL